MARYTESKISLTANQAAGVDPILNAENAQPGNRVAVLIGNPGSAVLNLHMSTGQAHGTGLPLVGYAALAFDGALPGFDGALYVTGAAAADKLTIWAA